MPTLMPSTPRSSRNRHAFGCRHVAGDELDVAESLAERVDRARHDGRMSVSDIDDDDVDFGAQQLGGAFEVVALGADCRAHTKPALPVARGERELALHDQILGGDESAQRAVGVDERQLLDLVRSHQLFGTRRARVAGVHHEPSRGVIRDATAPRSSTNRRSRVVSSPCTRRARP